MPAVRKFDRIILQDRRIEHTEGVYKELLHELRNRGVNLLEHLLARGKVRG